MAFAANARPDPFSICSRIKVGDCRISPEQVEVEVSSGGKDHLPRHRCDGRIEPCTGPNPWPVWREQELIEQGCCFLDCSRPTEQGGLLFTASDAHAAPLKAGPTGKGCSSVVRVRVSPEIETILRIVADPQKSTIRPVARGKEGQA